MDATAYDRRWDTLVVPKEQDRQPHTLKEGLIFSGNKSFDVNRLICSEYGQKIIDGMEPFFLSTDPMDPTVTPVNSPASPFFWLNPPVMPGKLPRKNSSWLCRRITMPSPS